LYADTIRQVYGLDAQDQAARYFGDSVTIEGTLLNKRHPRFDDPKADIDRA